MARCGFIGLGRMGSGIARTLIKTGNSLTVYDRSEESVAPFRNAVTVADTAGDLFAATDVTFLCLPGSPEVESVMEHFFAGNLAGRTVVDLSTSRPASSRKLAARLANEGNYFLDAPMTGGPAQAAEGRLTLIVGGEREVYERCLPLFECVAAKVFHVGAVGSGNVIKLMNNVICAGYVALYTQVLPIAEAAGVDMQALLEVLGASGAASPMFERYAPKIVNRDFDVLFTTALALKDTRYVEELFDEVGMRSDLVDTLARDLEEGMAAGLGERDMSELSRLAVTDRNGGE